MSWIAVGGAVASSAISYGANKLLAPKGGSGSGSGSAQAPLTSFTPPGINAGGLTSSFGPNGIGITADANRMAAVGGLQNTFGQQADALAGLRSTVAPGFSDLRTAALTDIENSRSAAIGNLRENLQRRRVLGSSFAQDAVSRGEAEFAKKKAETEAISYLQELEATQQLMQQEFAARRGVFQTGLDEMNLEATLAAGLAGKATDVLGKNAQVEAYLNAQEQAAQGKFIGNLVQPVADAAGKGFGKAAGNFFSGGGGTSTLNLMPTNI